jgi:hypothetical protein
MCASSMIMRENGEKKQILSRIIGMAQEKLDG